MKRCYLWSLLLVLAIPAAAEEAMTLDRQGFIHDWLIGGPYPSYEVNGAEQGLNDDLLIKNGGEAVCAPYPGMKEEVTFKADVAKLIAGIGSTNEWGFKENKTLGVTWKPFHGSTPVSYLDPQFFTPIKEHFVYYLVCYLESPEAQAVKLRIGSDDDNKVWLNGILVGQAAKAQGAAPDTFIYPATLKNGINRLLVKIVNRTGGTGFCVAVSDRQDRPLTDLKLYLDNPARRMGVNMYQNGFGVTLVETGRDLFAGENKLNIVFKAAHDGEYQLQLAGQVQNVSGSTEWNPTVKLAAGNTVLVLDVKQNGRTVVSFRQPIEVYDRARLATRTDALKQKLIQVQTQLQSEVARGERLQSELRDARAALQKTYGIVEARYAAQHAAAAKNAPVSGDRPLIPATLRSRVCINGDWNVKIGNSAWRTMRLPTKEQHGGTLIFRKELELEPSWGAATFVCENAVGRLQVYFNGELAGEYMGKVGIIEIPLPPVKTGKNVLELRFSSLRDNGIVEKSFDDRNLIAGDLFLNFSNPVSVAGVQVKTSWRKAELSTITELTNRTAQPVEVQLTQYVVKAANVKVELPPQRVTVPAHGSIEVKNSIRWGNPELWEPATPVMYDLVSDLRRQDKLIDRQVQPFGFREVWIYATDFFLNGHRQLFQGNTFEDDFANLKYSSVMLPLLRHDGINLLRLWQYDPKIFRLCDRLGMFTYTALDAPAFYAPGQEPGNAFKAIVPGFKLSSYDDFLRSNLHRYNLDNYRRWFKMLRNSPSIVLWGSDNEILTQAWDTEARAAINIRNDRLGALYGRFVKSLDPDIIITRDGDVGTWNHKQRWYEDDPPCDTANYHYPDFNINEWVMNWQDVYEYRPVVFGETLYFAYGAWNNNVGALPSQIVSHEKKVRSVLGLYRELEIPAFVGMGLSGSGFVSYDDTGKGNPWGVKASTAENNRKNPPPQKISPDGFPYAKISWPAMSGSGRRPLMAVTGSKYKGSENINWFDVRYSSHVRNALNDTYREQLRPQPPLSKASDAEVVVTAGPGQIVWTKLADGQRYGILGDAEGKAWFELPAPGAYTFEYNGKSHRAEVPGRAAYAESPGFEQVPRINLP